MVVGKNLYKNGKLTDEARARLTAKQNKGKKTKAKTTTAPTNPTSSKSSARTQPKAAPTAKTNVATTAEEPLTIDTPPRNSKVRARAAALAANQDANWVKIVEYNQECARMEEKQMGTLEKKCGKIQKTALEKQLKARQAAREEEKAKKLAHQAELKDEYKRWEEEDSKKAAKIHSKVEVIKREREEQIALLNKRRAREAKKQQLRAARDKATAIKALEAEKAKQQKRKEEKIELMKQVRIENELEREKKLKAQEEDAKTTKIQMEQYAAKLKAQEEAREQALQATFAAQEKKQAALKDATAGARKADEEATKRATREQRQYEQIADAREQKKVDDRNAFQMSINRSIAQQRLEQAELKRKEIEEDKRFGQKAAEEAKKYDLAEAKKVADRKKVMTDNMVYLRKQMAANEIRKQAERAEMNDTERKMNKNLLDDVKAGKKQVGVIFDPKQPYAWKNQRKTGQY